jgi:hypothetical protein
MTVDPGKDARVGRRSRAPRHAVRPIFRQPMLRRCCLINIKIKRFKKGGRKKTIRELADPNQHPKSHKVTELSTVFPPLAHSKWKSLCDLALALASTKQLLYSYVFTRLQSFPCGRRRRRRKEKHWTFLARTRVVKVFFYLKTRAANGESHGHIGPATLAIVLP